MSRASRARRGAGRERGRDADDDSSRATRRGTGRQRPGPGGESERGSSSRRRTAGGRRSDHSGSGSGVRQRDGSSSRRGTAAAPAGDSRPAGRDRRRGKGEANADGEGGKRSSGGFNLGSHLPMLAGGVAVLLMIIGALVFNPIRRSLKLNEIADAPDATAALERWYEYETLVGGDEDRLRGALSMSRGPEDARITFAAEKEFVTILLSIALSPNYERAHRLAAMNAAADLLIEEPSLAKRCAGLVTPQLVDMVIQENAEDPDLDQAVAAIRVISAYRKPIAGREPMSYLLALLRDTSLDAVIHEAVVENLHRNINTSTVGHVMRTFPTPNGTDLINQPEIVKAVANTAKASHLDSVFTLLDSDSDPVQAAGMAILKGPGIAGSSSNIAPEEREIIGQRVSAYLTTETRDAKPRLFGESLQAVQSLRLTGARDQLFTLMGEVEPESQEAITIAQTLGKTFLAGKREEMVPVAEDILAKLTAALDDEAKRWTAAQAINQITFGELTGLRPALEKLVHYGDDYVCMQAAVHIVKDLYQRTDVVQALGTDPANADAWREFLAKDKPRFDHYLDIQDWYAEASQYIRTTDDPAVIRKNRIRCREEIDLLERWLQDSTTPLPLGLLPGHVKDLKHKLETLAYALMKATPGL